MSDITFGLELEFLVPARHNRRTQGPGHNARQYQGSLARSQVCGAILNDTNQPVASICYHVEEEDCAVCKDVDEENRICLSDHGGTWFTICSAKNAHHVPGTNAFTQFFIVKTEGLRGDGNDIRNWRGLELNTPIMTTKDLGDDLEDVEDVTTAITNQDFTVCINHDCGFHAHFGRTVGMNLLYAKKAASLVFLLEQKLIHVLCPEFRTESEHYRLVSVRSKVAQDQRLSQHIQDTEKWEDDLEEEYEAHIPNISELDKSDWGPEAPNDLDDILRTLWQARHLPDIEWSLTSTIDAKMGIFLSLRDANGPIISSGGMNPPSATASRNLEGSPSTLEFRYPPSTFDHDLVLSWTKLFHSIMEVALLEQDLYFQKFEQLVKTLEHEDQPWAELLTDLGLEEDIKFWTETLEENVEEGYTKYHLHTAPVLGRQ